eukprot:TRINITY_DN3549_c0_g1_i14.p1 TRINITY_DN3549_c0_g1~~TRINITY_DN3549_c0_g1_i14.p1  ORF type:complete len:394 (-),score=70.45 TRINITY_DN3549_c0_g1_i14:522-1622(-)
MAPPPSPPAHAAPAAAGNGSGEPSPTSVFQLMLLVGRLKTTKRAGWVISGIPAPESVSDHMYRMAMAAFALPPAVSAHAIKLALVHDLAEALVGDITPHDGVSGEEKERRERAAMATVRDEVLQGEGALGSHLVDLWEEYEAGETEAARLVKDVDKYEMIVQAYEYEGCTFLWVSTWACAGGRQCLAATCVTADGGSIQVGRSGTALCPCALLPATRLCQPATRRPPTDLHLLTPVPPHWPLSPAACAMPRSASMLPLLTLAGRPQPRARTCRPSLTRRPASSAPPRSERGSSPCTPPARRGERRRRERGTPPRRRRRKRASEASFFLSPPVRFWWWLFGCVWRLGGGRRARRRHGRLGGVAGLRH